MSDHRSASPSLGQTEFSFVPFTLNGEPISGGTATIHYRKYSTTFTPRKGVVFFLHGNKGNMDKCEFQIEFMLELGYDVWTMDYRGYGDSDGKISEAAFKSDARAVFDKIVAEVDAESLVIWGRSFGSGVAASVAASTQKKPKMFGRMRLNRGSVLCCNNTSYGCEYAKVATWSIRYLL